VFWIIHLLSSPVKD